MPPIQRLDSLPPTSSVRPAATGHTYVGRRRACPGVYGCIQDAIERTREGESKSYGQDADAQMDAQAGSDYEEASDEEANPGSGIRLGEETVLESISTLNISNNSTASARVLPSKPGVVQSRSQLCHCRSRAMG